MSFVLTIYTEHVYREVFLPELHDSDYPLYLRDSEYVLAGDVLLPMEVVDGKWTFPKQGESQIVSDGTDAKGKPLQSGQVLRIITPHNDTVATPLPECAA